jgi:hypothetical protein
LVTRVDDGRRGARAVALHHVAHALVDGRLERVGGFLRAELVVDADDLELDAGGVLLVEVLGQNWKLLSWFWPTGAIRPDSAGRSRRS